MDIRNTNSKTINVSPTFGGRASFSSLSDSTKYGDNHSQRMLQGINSISMSLSLNFQELTNAESHNLISFLQSHVKYKLQNYVNNGSFDNKRIEPFTYQPFFPYRSNDFYCLSFTHEKTYYNVNNISAELECVVPSILESVESSAGHNPNIDALINATLNASSSCKDNAVVLNPNDKIYHSGDYSVATIDSTYNPSVGFSQTLSATADFPFSSGRISSNQTALRNSIFINNPNDCFFYPYNPIHEDGILETRMFDFRPSESMSLQYSPSYRRSTVSEMYKKFNLYGFNPNLSNLQLSFDGRSDKEAKSILLFLESHLGYKKFGFHSFKEYGGNNSDASNSTPHRKTLSFFYCPEWTHTFNYKNNHSISATFIECMDY